MSTVFPHPQGQFHACQATKVREAVLSGTGHHHSSPRRKGQEGTAVQGPPGSHVGVTSAWDLCLPGICVVDVANRAHTIQHAWHRGSGAWRHLSTAIEPVCVCYHCSSCTTGFVGLPDVLV